MLPIYIATSLQPKERIKSANFRKIMSWKMCKMSYRIATDDFNRDFHRKADGSELNISTFKSYYAQECRNMRRMKNALIMHNLINSPFEPETGKLTDSNVLPDEMRCNPIRLIKFNYDLAMANERPLWDFPNGTRSNSVKDNTENEIEEDIDEVVKKIIEDELEKDITISEEEKEIIEKEEERKENSQNDPIDFIKDWLRGNPEANGFSMPAVEKYRSKEKKRGPKAVPPSKETREQNLLDYIRKYNMYYARRKGHGIIHDWSMEFDSSDVLYLSIDVVYVPLQKAGARNITDNSIITTFHDDKKKNVGHVNIKVEQGEKIYNITGPTEIDAFKELLAVIMVNKLYNYYFIVFFDGEKALYDKVKEYLGCWNPEFILDFAHLSHKCQELLSSAIKSQRVIDPWEEPERYKTGKNKGKVRKWPMTSLSRLYGREISHILWVGNIDEAIEYLRKIDPEHVAKPIWIDKLIAYLENKKHMNCITCYAARKFLGLKNSSNTVESENEAIVSNRQKSGDHWSIEGSRDNAAMSALFLNHEDDNWFFKNTLSFRMFNPKDYIGSIEPLDEWEGE